MKKKTRYSNGGKLDYTVYCVYPITAAAKNKRRTSFVKL